MNIRRFFIKVQMSLLDYDILKVISEQLRLLAWASPPVWLWFGWHTTSKGKTALVIVMLWLSFQIMSLLVLKLSIKFKEGK